MFKSLRKVAVLSALTAASVSISAPVQAQTVVDPCSATWVSGGIGCVGYVNGNLFQGGAGSSTSSTIQGLINQLLTGTPTAQTAAYAGPYMLNTGTVLGAVSPLNGSATINFGSLLLSGLTVVGIHFGNTPDAGGQRNTSALWLVNVAGSTNTLNLTNGQGSSNAQIFATSVAAVPEPATWAMMLLGFGVIGFGLSRKRRPQQSILQLV